METADFLVVDAANVVGARPDGWWRDRAGATLRLLSRLERLDPTYGQVVLVVEGRATTVEASPASPAQVVRAVGSGDDAIVATVESLGADADGRGVRITVVTSDRELVGRVERLGATVHGASWLWNIVDGLSDH